MRGYGYEPHFVAGDDPADVHQQLAAALDAALDEIAEIQRRPGQAAQCTSGRRWPMIVLRTPKGWTGPKEVDGMPVEGTFRAHQVPLAETRTNPEHRALLEDVAAQLPPGGAVRRRRRAASRAAARWPRRASGG